MFAAFVLIALAADDDLRALKIPPEAVERPDSWRPRGLIKKKRDYFVGAELVGERLFYEDGRVADERLYRDKKLHGMWRQFWPNGTLFAERPYRNGQMDGTFRFWDEQGNRIRESELRNGTGLLREADNAQLHSDDAETHYVDGKRHGLQTRWGRFEGCTGLGYSTSYYKRGKLDGPIVTRDEDGTLIGYANAKDGHLHGVSHKLERDGSPRSGFPKYYIKGEEVTKERLMEAAKTDKVLAETLTHSPPRTEKPPAHDKPAGETTQTTAVGAVK